MQIPCFLFGAKGASVGESIKQRQPFRCTETKTSRTAGWRSSGRPSRRHRQSLWQARTNFSQDKCTRCSPSKWPVVGALPAQYLGRGPRPRSINRTSHSQEGLRNRTLARTTNTRTPPLARQFFPCIAHHQPLRQSTTPQTRVGYYTTMVAQTSINLVSLLLFFV